MIRLQMAILLVGASFSVAAGENLFHIEGGQLRGPWPFDPWCAELEDWQAMPTNADELQHRLQPWAARGLNTVILVLHTERRPFFSPDGRPLNEDLGKRFTALTSNVRNAHFATIVILFSGESGACLKDAAAYREAVQAAAKLVREWQSCIFVMGRPTADRDRAFPCSFPLDDSARQLELCRIAKAARPDVLVAVPAPSTADKTALFVADSAEALSGSLKDSANVVSVLTSQMWRCRDKTASDLGAFLERVEKTRTSIRPPGTNLPVTRSAAIDGWTALFNGHSLDGWMTLKTDWAAWVPKDGMIEGLGRSDQWLRTRERYIAFILQLEYKVSPKGNTGVFIWAPLDARASRFGMELQLLGLRRKELNEDTTGAIYDVRPPKLDASKDAGEWNTIEIECRPPRFKATINGQVVQDFNADDIPKLKGRLREGFIGLQDHGDPVWFRNIRLKPLPAR